MSDYDMKDSGEREEFTTGAVRDSREGKGRYDLIPVIALKRVAAVYEKGASKYTPRNWEAGLNQSRCYDSALRHLMQYAEGLRDEDHLAQAAFNVLAMIFTEEQVNRGNLPASLMDLPSYLKKPLPPPTVAITGTSNFVSALKKEAVQARHEYDEHYGTDKPTIRHPTCKFPRTCPCVIPPGVESKDFNCNIWATSSDS